MDLVKKEKEIWDNKESFGSDATANAVYADCFKGLFVSLVSEMFMSSDTKQIVILGMWAKLKRIGYTEEQIESIKENLLEVTQKNFTKNDFMG